MLLFVSEYPNKGYLSEISSPSRLWYQTDDPELIRIDEDLNGYYDVNHCSKVQQIDSDEVYIGMKIATFICRKWHRATIISNVQPGGIVCVFADDFGTKGYVNLKFCRVLPADFIKIERKSIKACLHGIAPPNNARLFDIEATSCIIKFCYNRLFGIKIVRHHENVSQFLFKRIFLGKDTFVCLICSNISSFYGPNQLKFGTYHSLRQ